MSLPGNYNLIGDSHIASATCGQFFNTCELLTNGSTRTPRTTDSLPAAASGVAADREHLHYSAYESIAKRLQLGFKLNF